MWKTLTLLGLLAWILAACGNAMDDGRLRGLEDRLDRLSKRIEDARSDEPAPTIEQFTTEGGEGKIVLAFWPGGNYHIWHIGPDGSGGYQAKSLGYQSESGYLRSQ